MPYRKKEFTVKYRKLVPIAARAALLVLGIAARRVFLSQAAETYYTQGVQLDEQGRPEEARQAFQKAITLRSDWAQPHYSLGLVLNKLNRYSEAIAPFQQAIRLRPSNSRSACKSSKIGA